MTQAFVFKVKNLKIQYGKRLILSQANFAIAAGSRTAILGINGAGKSSLLRVLAGAGEPYQGEISFYNQELIKYSTQALAQKRAVIEQRQNPAFGLNVAEVLASIASWKNHPKSKQFEKIVRDFQIAHLMQAQHAQLSGGELARVAMVRALWQLLQAPAGLDNQLLLLDEPSAALDLSMQELLFQQLKAWNEREKLTVLAVLHDLNQALFYFPQVLIVHAGQIWGHGAAETWLTPPNIETIWGQKVCAVDVDAPQKRRVFIPISG